MRKLIKPCPKLLRGLAMKDQVEPSTRLLSHLRLSRLTLLFTSADVNCLSSHRVFR